MEQHRKISTTDWIVDTFKKRIAAGEYAVGERLPPQFELAKSMNVGRSSIREAMRELQALGLIELKTGSGAYLRSVEITPESAVRWFQENAAALGDLFEVRYAIEPMAARLAASRARSQDISALGEICQRFADASARVDAPALVTIDEEFHAKVMEISHNPLFSQMNEMLAHALRKYRQRSYRIPETLSNAVEPHWDICKAIQARDANLAALHMTRHLEISLRDISAAAHMQ